MCHKIPESTDSTIIFRYYRSTRSFDTKTYSSTLTDDRMSLDEVVKTLQDIQQIHQPFFRKIIRAVSLYVLFVLIWTAVYVAVRVTTDGTGAIIASVLTYTLILCAVAFIYTVYAIRKKRGCIKAVQNFLDKCNQDTLSKDLRWKIPKRFPKWVELHKDYLLQSPRPEKTMPAIINLNFDMKLDAGMMQGQPQQFGQNYYAPSAVIYPSNLVQQDHNTSPGTPTSELIQNPV